MLWGREFLIVIAAYCFAASTSLVVTCTAIAPNPYDLLSNHSTKVIDYSFSCLPIQNTKDFKRVTPSIVNDKVNISLKSP